jgi:hypothetical protein
MYGGHDCASIAVLLFADLAATYFDMRSRCISVGIATDYGMDG